jgi:hypothetical protein
VIERRSEALVVYAYTSLEASELNGQLTNAACEDTSGFFAQIPLELTGADLAGPRSANFGRAFDQELLQVEAVA